MVELKPRRSLAETHVALPYCWEVCVLQAHIFYNPLEDNDGILVCDAIYSIVDGWVFK